MIDSFRLQGMQAAHKNTLDFIRSFSETDFTEELKNWAGELARNTQDIVAVVNRMEVLDPPVLNFRPASSGLLM